MDRNSLVWDRVLGYGGIGLVVLAFVLVTADFGEDPEATTSVVGLAMVAWMVLVTVRHVRAHPGGAGRGLLIASWVVLAALVVFAVATSLDGAAFDDGVVDGLLSLAAAPPTLVLVVPLLLASLASLRDAGGLSGRTAGTPAAG